MSNSSAKYSRLQNSVPRTYDGNSDIQNSVSRSRATAHSRGKYIEIDKKNLPSLPIYQLLRAFNL